MSVMFSTRGPGWQSDVIRYDPDDLPDWLPSEAWARVTPKMVPGCMYRVDASWQITEGTRGEIQVSVFANVA